MDKPSLWCPFCGEPMYGEPSQATCCGEAGHGVDVDPMPEDEV